MKITGISTILKNIQADCDLDCPTLYDAYKMSKDYYISEGLDKKHPDFCGFLELSAETYNMTERAFAIIKEGLV